MSEVEQCTPMVQEQLVVRVETPQRLAKGMELFGVGSAGTSSRVASPGVGGEVAEKERSLA